MKVNPLIHFSLVLIDLVCMKTIQVFFLSFFVYKLNFYATNDFELHVYIKVRKRNVLYRHLNRTERNAWKKACVVMGRVCRFVKRKVTSRACVTQWLMPANAAVVITSTTLAFRLSRSKSYSMELHVYTGFVIA